MNKAIIHNPIIWADVPDPSVITVGDKFYMVSTSMHAMPGCPIMRSADLVNWEIVNYVFDTLENNDGHNLINGKHIYSKGSWAACLREHKGIFYVCFSSLDISQFYIYRTDDIEQGKWQRTVIKQLFHDPSLLFDGERVFVIHGNGNIRITELNDKLTEVKAGGINQVLLEAKSEGMALRAEGCHAYKINGLYYYFFIEWPRENNKRRRQICYRSENLLGPFEERIVLDDNMGYRNHGVAQGGIFSTQNGQWYSMLFQDHDAVGRIPVVLPVYWQNNWPIFGIEGTVPKVYETELPYTPTSPIVCSDEFEYLENKLSLQWQWNHNPDNALWSVTERASYLRLKTGAVIDSVLKAKNTLTQRTEGPACISEVLLDTSNMQEGDHAGLIALQYEFGTVGIKVEADGKRSVVMTLNDSTGVERVIESISYESKLINLKIEYNFVDSIDEARFYYACEQGDWQAIGQTLHMKYRLEHFMGYRTGLFNYASKQSGGFADFAYFRHYKLVDGEYKLIK